MSDPIELPLDYPVALRGPRRLSLVKGWFGRIATTAFFAPPRKLAAKPPRSPARVRLSHVDWVDNRLSDRDWAILASVDRLRVVVGIQLERLHFAELSDRSRARERRRVLRRLSDWRVIVPLERRIGGVRAGSDGLIFALDSTGQHLMHRATVRRPYTPTIGSLQHSLAVSELYIALVERARFEHFELLKFATEPACWWPDGHGPGHWLKPDAYLRLATQEYSDAWWLEQDMHRPDRPSEDLPTIRRKLLTYLDFVERGQTGPRGITPRVLISVQTAQRQAAIAGIIESLPDSAATLFHVTTADQAAGHLVQVLRG